MSADSAPMPLAAALSEVLTPALFRRWLTQQPGGGDHSLFGHLDTYLLEQLPGHALRLMWHPWTQRHAVSSGGAYLQLEEWVGRYIALAATHLAGAFDPQAACACLDLAIRQ